MNFLFLLASLNCLHTLYADKILVFLPLPIWSHQQQYEKLWTTLAERGHEVTIYSKIQPKSNHTNLRHVPIRLPKIDERMKVFDPAMLRMGQSAILGMFFLWDFGYQGSVETYETPEFKTLMASSAQYDLVITESFFAMESMVALGHRFNAPNIVICSFGVAPNSLDFHGGPNLPSFMPDYRTQFTDQMSFIERFQNFFILAITRVTEYVYYYPKHQALIDTHFGKDYPSLYSMLSNISVTFLYTSLAMSPPQPLVPNMIPVGGIHLKNPGKLPTDLQKRADTAGKSGFIYMSFGSVVDPAKLDSETKLAFLEVFRKIKLPILWKIDIANDPVINSKTIPENVFIQKWYPQTDILAHPNLRLFITHGGISSLMETTNLGVPILGIPFFGDQHKNLVLLEQRGYALIQPFRTLTKESFLSKVQTMLEDPKFKQNAQKWAAITNDRIVSPLDTAVYWIEYVLRHQGAPELSSHSRHLSWHVLYSVDIVLVSLALAYAVVKLLSMCCCRRSANKSVISTKKNN